MKRGRLGIGRGDQGYSAKQTFTGLSLYTAGVTAAILEFYNNAPRVISSTAKDTS